MTIESLVNKLQSDKESLIELLTIYNTALPPNLIENAKKAVLERAPYKTLQLIKALNLVAGSQVFSEDPMTHTEMMDFFESNKQQIEELIERSKTMNKEIIGIAGDGKVYNIYKIIATALYQIQSVSDEANGVLSAAKLSIRD